MSSALPSSLPPLIPALACVGIPVAPISAAQFGGSESGQESATDETQIDTDPVTAVVAVRHLCRSVFDPRLSADVVHFDAEQAGREQEDELYFRRTYLAKSLAPANGRVRFVQYMLWSEARDP